MKQYRIIMVLMLLCVGSLIAQEVTLNSTVSRSEIYIGDRFEYMITIAYPDSSVIELPGLIGNLGTFEVREHQVSESVSGKGVTTQKWTLLLSTFLSGEYVVPPQVVEFLPKGDTTKVQLFTEPIKITVLNRNSEDVTDILEVEGVVGAPMALQTILIIVGSICFALLVLIIVLIRRKRNKESAIVLPPYEEAKKQLNELKHRNLMETGAYKDHFFELTEILKHYISRRFNVDASEATTAELLERVTLISEIEGELKEALPQFCEKTDLIKFAKMTLDDTSNTMLNEYVEGFVEQTKPSEELSVNGPIDSTKGAV
ncbi:MAG: BatD family protein [Fibrobacterales bacterium]